ncbi:MAG: ammonium transporter [Chloroflexota bacterium]|nr:ammonium transporter [Chloroflexota bacterium]
MGGSRFSGLQKLVALSLITLIAIFVAAKFAHGDASGTSTGVASDAATFSGNGGTAFTDPNCALNASPAPADTGAAVQSCAKQDPGQLATAVGHNKVGINFTWTLIMGSFVLFMQAGFALLTTGLTRAKNAGHMMMLNFGAFVIAFIGYWAIGFAFQFGGAAINAAPGNLGGAMVLGHLIHVSSTHWGLFGASGFFLQSGHTYDVGALALFFFEVVFMETAGYIIVGAIAERINFKTFILAELLIGGIVYPIYGNWVWGGGWLSQIGNTLNMGHGAVDFAGSGVVHATGGWAALALAVLLGPRIGKFNEDGSPNAIPGHSLPFVVTGTFILLFGWMGFNPGSTLGATDLRVSVIIVNTVTASVFGAAAAMAFTAWVYGKPDISMACNGMLAGLVAITAPCAFVSPWAAALIGFIAGFIVCGGVWFFDHVAHIDDPCGAVSVHGLNGAWGVIALGLFADGTYGAGWNGISGNVTGLFYGDAGQLGAQLVSVAVCFAWGFGVTATLFGVYKLFTSMRVSPEAEIRGLDVPEFGVPGYAGFVMERELHGAIPAELLREAGLAPVPAPKPSLGGAPAGGGG